MEIRLCSRTSRVVPLLCLHTFVLVLAKSADFLFIFSLHYHRLEPE